MENKNKKVFINDKIDKYLDEHDPFFHFLHDELIEAFEKYILELYGKKIN